MEASSAQSAAATVPPPSVSPSVGIRQSAAATSSEGHQLTYTWCMWCAKKKTGRKGGVEDKSKKSDDYHPNRITEFSTVEQFWSLFKFLEREASNILKSYVQCSFFREGIEPCYEDEHNSGGGRIVMAIKGDDNLVMKYLRETAMLVIGHQFEAASEAITGIFLSWKATEWQLSVWMNKKDQKLRRLVAAKLLETLQLPETVEMKWFAHDQKKDKKFIDMRKSLKKAAESAADAAPSPAPSPAPAGEAKPAPSSDD